MKKSPFLLSLLALALLAIPSSAARTGHAVYRPGLTQARIPLGSPMGYVTAYTGVPALEGEIFVEQGTEYYFYGRFWTGEALVVDGTTAVWQGPHNGYNYPPDVYGAWTAPKTGWVPFNAWEWTCEESHSPQWATWGLEYNLSGLAVEGEDQPDKRQLAQNSYTNVWLRFADPGNGSFLRTRTDERFLTIGASEPVASDRSFSLSFADVPTNAQLVACTGPVDGVHDTNGWANVSAVLADVAPGNSTTTVSVPLPAGANVLRFRSARFRAPRPFPRRQPQRASK